MLDYNGEVVKTYDYDAYGNELNRDLSDENPFRYCGEYYDTETGLIYLRARYYDPSVGRFTSKDIHWNPYNSIYGDNPVKTQNSDDSTSYYPDQLAIKQSSNQYAYCTNNPVIYIDLDGESILAVVGGILLSSVISGITGGLINQSKGNDFWSGFCGGFVNGAISSTSALLGPFGIIFGSAVGGFCGSLITNSLNGENNLSALLVSAICSAVGGAITGSISSYISICINEANLAGSIAKFLMNYDEKFGEFIYMFFSTADDAISYQISDVVEEYTRGHAYE